MERVLRKKSRVNYREGLCGCNPRRGNKCEEGSDCLNRNMRMFCTTESCSAGGQCKNRRDQALNCVEVKMTKTTGKGVFATEDIAKGSYILQCTGAVLSEAEFQKHNRAVKGAFICSFCIMPGVYIDMCKGTIARFLNHACNPNATADKMTEDGLSTLSIIAIRPIKKGDEITIAYNSDTLGFVCHCEDCTSNSDM